MNTDPKRTGTAQNLHEGTNAAGIALYGVQDICRGQEISEPVKIICNKSVLKAKPKPISRRHVTT
jgi:hypothetical protein